ncbi:MAG: TlyA family RNA methyltransferase [Candidatus Sungbacteria bacterium]|uniref:TlyA family RNA methyltransferase n=1 Tax=Candidatus Sungiibacteriota bacterium TaxID=2750080 RepID=A0A931SCW1_9BACT|nr:TlyA family RNA methyltransferase [Candidatus Sungbacteria bacterium]
MRKKRLDEILIERGIVKDKNEAFIWVTEGRVFVGGQKAISPAQMFDPDIPTRVRERFKYVGRGGLKLEAALEAFSVSVEGKVCVDIGAATGGFTDVLLQRGAKKVYAIDTGRGKLALRLREDPRVVVMERTNILYLESLPEPIEFGSIDVSLTSLRLVLPVLNKFLAPGAEVVALFKPQYEVDLSKLHHGIVEHEIDRQEALDIFREWAGEHHWEILHAVRSSIQGAKGNVEYLLYLIPQ